MPRGSAWPKMSRVILGWVRVKGAVETDATGTGDKTFEIDGSDTTNGMKGVVMLNSGGAGFITVADT